MWQSLRHIRSWLSASHVIPAVGMKREKQHQVQIGPRKFLTQNGWDITHQTLGRQQCPGSLTTSSLKLVLPHHRKQWRPNRPFHPGYKQLPCSAQSLFNALSCLVEAERLLHWDREISSPRHREIFCWKCFNVQVVTKGRPYVWVVCLWTSSSLPCCTQRCLHVGLVLSRNEQHYLYFRWPLGTRGPVSEHQPCRLSTDANLSFSSSCCCACADDSSLCWLFIKAVSVTILHESYLTTKPDSAGSSMKMIWSPRLFLIKTKLQPLD